MDFDTFWKTYPRRIGKGTARKAWEKAIRLATPEEIIAGLESQLHHLQMQYRGPREDFRPHPSTWLNSERWADEYDAPMTGHDMVQAALKEKWEREDHAGIESTDKQLGDKSTSSALPLPVGRGYTSH